MKIIFKTGTLKNFAIFTGKQLCWSLFLIKLRPWRPATLLKRDSNTGVFLWILRPFQKHFFYRTPLQLALRVAQWAWDKHQYTKAVVCSCSLKRYSYKFCKIHKKTHVLECLFNKTGGLRPVTSSKSGSSSDVFLWIFFFTEHVRWLLLNIKLLRIKENRLALSTMPS